MVAPGIRLLMAASRPPAIATTELTDDFNRSNINPIDGWDHYASGGSSTWQISSSAALFHNTTGNCQSVNQTSISAGSTFAKCTNLVNGTQVKVRAAASTNGGYGGGRHYFNSAAGDWRWSITRNNSEVEDGAQVPYVAPGTGADVRLELQVVGSSVRLRLYVNDAFCCEYLDTSPLTDTQKVGIYADGRGGVIPGLDNFAAGIID